MTDVAADIASRPQWLKPFALVEGNIMSAPLDLPQRMEQVYDSLKKQGWQIAVKSIGTDFTSPEKAGVASQLLQLWALPVTGAAGLFALALAQKAGMPVPQYQPLSMYMHRPDRPYTALEAKIALASTLAFLNLTYNVVGAYAGEVYENIIKPTINLQTPTTDLKPWIIGGLLVFGGLYAYSTLKPR